VPPLLVIACVLLARRRQRAAWSAAVRPEEVSGASAAEASGAERLAAARLKRAASAAQRVRVRVSGTLLLLSYFLLVLGVWPVVIAELYSAEKSHPALARNTFFGSAIPLALALALLAFMPKDDLWIRRGLLPALFVFGLFFGGFLVNVGAQRLVAGVAEEQRVAEDPTRTGYPPYERVNAALNVATGTPLVALAAVAVAVRVRWTSGRTALHRLWRAVRLAFAVDGLLAVAYATYVIADPTAMRELHCNTCDPATAEENNCSECTPAAVAETSANEALAWFVLGGALLGTAVLTTARVRRGVHSFLGSLGMEGEARNAAAVAALLGGATVADAVAQGKDNLRALPLDALTRDDLVGSADTGLNKKVVRAKFGDVDAFLSHSWHDSGSAKWAALQAWAEAFERAHGRRPTIWLDKACIDQQNIQASLAGLPVYLSGCDSMLVLIGKTYLSRLWCAALPARVVDRSVRFTPKPPSCQVRHRTLRVLADRRRQGEDPRLPALVGRADGGDALVL